MPFLPINGVKLNYIQMGNGPDVVLAHGLASSLGFWYPGIVLPLRAGYRVTAYDLRGHGYSGMPSSGYTHMNMATDLAGLVDRLGLRKFHLVGHSFGGLVSISYALRYPQRLKSLVLADVPLNEINSIPEWPVWWPSLKAFRDVGVVIHQDEPYPELRLLEELASPQVRQRVSKLLPHGSRLPYEWGKGTERTAKRWLQLLNTSTARDDIRFRQVSAADLGQIGVRTLAVYGGESKWRSSSEVLHDHLPGVQIAQIEKAGHAHPWERPNDFLYHLSHFLEVSEHLCSDSCYSRRKYERLPLEMEVYLRSNGGAYCQARTVNVSRNGLLLDCLKAPGSDSEVEIVVSMNRNGSDLVLPGKVVWKETKLAGEGEGIKLAVNLFWHGGFDATWEEFLTQH